MKQAVNSELMEKDQAKLDDAIGNILDALVFPVYIGKIVWVPILLGIGITVVITIVNFDHWWSDLLFGIIAFVFMIPIIVIASPLFILHKIKTDIIQTVQACINVSISIASDTKGTESDKKGAIQKSKRGAKASLNHIVVPSVCAAANSKPPIFGRFFSFLLSRTTKKLSAEEASSSSTSKRLNEKSKEEMMIKPPKTIAKVFNGLIWIIVIVTAPIVLFCVMMINLFVVIFS